MEEGEDNGGRGIEVEMAFLRKADIWREVSEREDGCFGEVSVMRDIKKRETRIFITVCWLYLYFGLLFLDLYY